MNGLVGAGDPHGVYLNLARRSGGSHLQLVLRDAEPPTPADSGEDVVEVSVTIPHGSPVRWVSWAGESSGDVDGLSGGSYRVFMSGVLSLPAVLERGVHVAASGCGAATANKEA